MLKLTQERERLGMSQRKLAKEAGLEAIELNKLERGRLHPYPKYRTAIAEALGWDGDPMELFEEVEASEPASISVPCFLSLDNIFIAPKVWPVWDGEPCSVEVVFDMAEPTKVSVSLKLIRDDEAEGPSFVVSRIGDISVDHFNIFGDEIKWAFIKEDTNA